MKKSTATILLILIFSTFTHVTNAADFWIKNTQKERYYTVIDQEDGITVKHFRQEEGDYQDKLETKSFQKISEAIEFIKINYPDYKHTKILPAWEINFNDSDDKKKKNKTLWEVSNSWSVAWESRYADWLKSEITADFYTKYNIATDCADALIGYRWIFARIHSLPVANTIADTGSLFGHFSMRKQWENLPTSGNWYDDQLFMAALNYVMDLTSTRTIMANDGFHVAVTRAGLQAGTFIVSQTNGSGHIRTITQNFYEDPNSLPLFTFSSTSPRELRALYKEAFVDQAWPIRKVREIMAFRWPIQSGKSWILTKKENDYRYSQEQFDSSFHGKYYSFIQFVLNRVQPTYNPYSLITTGVEDIVNYTNIRVKIVRDGFDYCRNHDCRPGSQGYEDWSTPNRDAKYVLKFDEIEDLIKGFDPMYPGLYSSWLNALSTTEVNVEENILSLERLRYLFVKKLTSYNPNDPILRRWGLHL